MNWYVDDVWINTLNNLLNLGRPVRPREQGTYELMAYQTIVDMRQPILCVGDRRLSYEFMAAEAAWILSGDNRVSSIKSFAPSIEQFSDDGERFFGAYGPRVTDQLSGVVAALNQDRESRQAVMTIWRPNPPPTKDVPCTVALQWLVRDDQLHCVATMRSSDIWLGWPYDVFNFSMISRVIFYELAPPVSRLGNLYLTVGSQHLYLKNADRARECLKGESWVRHPAIDLLDDTAINQDLLLDYLRMCATSGGLVATE